MLTFGLSLALLTAGAEAAKRRPAVAVSSLQPLIVVGTGFEPRERVSVRAAGDGQLRSKLVRATLAGRFTVRFGVAIEDCSPLTVSASGSAGSRARLREIPPPGQCGVELAP